MHHFEVGGFEPYFLSLCEWLEFGTFITLLGHKVLGMSNGILGMGS